MIRVIESGEAAGMHEWEELEDGVARLRVPNGWIYRFLYVDSVAAVFVRY
jgi:hypothetical protein